MWKEMIRMLYQIQSTLACTLHCIIRMFILFICSYTDMSPNYTYVIVCACISRKSKRTSCVALGTEYRSYRSMQIAFRLGIAYEDPMRRSRFGTCTAVLTHGSRHRFRECFNYLKLRISFDSQFGSLNRLKHEPIDLKPSQLFTKSTCLN